MWHLWKEGWSILVDRTGSPEETLTVTIYQLRAILDCWLLVYRITTEFCVWISHPVASPSSFIMLDSILTDPLGSSTVRPAVYTVVTPPPFQPMRLNFCSASASRTRQVDVTAVGILALFLVSREKVPPLGSWPLCGSALLVRVS